MIKINKKYNRLTTIKLLPEQKVLCACDCGETRAFSRYYVLHGRTKSCGCYRKYLGRKSLYKHGESDTRPHRIWQGMRNRCNSPTSPIYKYYGGRGITVCKRWDDYTKFIDDMGYPPDNSHQIERVDNNKGYSPENCKWATRAEQARNRRSSVIVTIGSDARTVTEWLRHLGVSKGKYGYRRHIGMSSEEAIKDIFMSTHH